MTIGEKIKKHRKAMKMTQTELGERLGVQKNAVSKWETGRVEDIPTGKIRQMAELFDVPVAYLVQDELETPASRANRTVSPSCSTCSTRRGGAS